MILGANHAGASHQLPVPLELAVPIVVIGLIAFVVIVYDLVQHDDPW